MKGGRLKIVNESRYPDEEVERLVRFGLDEIDLTGSRVVVVVKDTRPTRRRQPSYSGVAYSLDGGIPRAMYDRYCGKRTHTRHLLVLRLGAPNTFPVSAFRRYAGVDKDEFRDWREALVAIAAHEGMHAQHDHDGAYRTRSGFRRPATFTDPVTGRSIPYRRGGAVRVGSERIEPKCEAFEAYMLRRWRRQTDFATLEPGNMTGR